LLAGGSSQTEALLRRYFASSPEASKNHGSLSSFMKTVGNARTAAQDAAPLDVIKSIVAELDLPTMVTGNPPSDELHAATSMALEVARRRGDVPGREAWTGVVAELAELRLDNDGIGEAVSALTIHRSKGLEFDHVVLLGVQGDKFPNLQFVEAGTLAMEEERRLFYVAMTRARTHLVVTNHAKQSAGSWRGPERHGFISELPQDTSEV